MADDHQMMWLEDEEEAEQGQAQAPQQLEGPDTELVSSRTPAEAESAIAQLEAELQRTKKELQDVRKDLAAKTVQLSRKEVVVVHEKVAEMAASVAGEKERQLQQQLQQVTQHVEHLEAVLATKEEELEESRRSYNAQKRVLREALATAAEVEAAQRQADEARARTVAAEAVEDELEQLQQKLALLQARYELELRARTTELRTLREELITAGTDRKEAVAAAEAALTEAWQAEVARATEEAEARCRELAEDLTRARAQLEEQAHSGNEAALAGELAALAQQKVAVQREFEAFKEMATAAARQNREDAAKMMEENAMLKARLAAKAVADLAAGVKPQPKVFNNLASSLDGSSDDDGSTAGGGGRLPLLGGLLALGRPGHLSELLTRLERKRRGVVPALVLALVLALFVVIAVVRAAAVTRSEHRGGLCFLAHLGITLGQGCGLPDKAVKAATNAKLGALLDAAPRVHDIAVNQEAVASALAGKVPGGVALRRRLLLQLLQAWRPARAKAGAGAGGRGGVELAGGADDGSASQGVVGGRRLLAGGEGGAQGVSFGRRRQGVSALPHDGAEGPRAAAVAGRAQL